MKRRAEVALTSWFALLDRRPLRGARQVGKSTLVRQAAAIWGVDLWEVNLARHVDLRGPFESLDVAKILLEIGVALRPSVGRARGSPVPRRDPGDPSSDPGLAALAPRAAGTRRDRGRHGVRLGV